MRKLNLSGQYRLLAQAQAERSAHFASDVLRDDGTILMSHRKGCVCTIRAFFNDILSRRAKALEVELQ